MAWQPQIVVFDEGHYLKNRKAARTKACLGTPLEPSPITRASHVWALSGTPMPNDASELYTIFKRFWPERLKQLGISTFGHWLNTFCVFWEGQWGTQVSGIKNEALLHKLLFEEGRMLRRTFLDVAPDVPPMVWGTDLVSAEDAKIPRELLIDRATIETWTTAGEMPDELQYASERRALGHYKAEYAVQEITEMLADGAMQKIVVFGWHKDVLNILETGLRRFGVVRWDGSTAGKDRPGILAAFHGDRARVFIGQIEACGTAIDLSAADHAYFAELAFSPGMNQQAAERVRAITKLVPCAVTVLQVQDTYDEAHAQIIVRKSNMQKAVDLHGV
jgi:SNF2 family DNA or RNA helicase